MALQCLRTISLCPILACLSAMPPRLTLSSRDLASIAIVCQGCRNPCQETQGTDVLGGFSRYHFFGGRLCCRLADMMLSFEGRPIFVQELRERFPVKGPVWRSLASPPESKQKNDTKLSQAGLVNFRCLPHVFEGSDGIQPGGVQFASSPPLLMLFTSHFFCLFLQEMPEFFLRVVPQQHTRFQARYISTSASTGYT